MLDLDRKEPSEELLAWREKVKAALKNANAYSEAYSEEELERDIKLYDAGAYDYEFYDTISFDETGMSVGDIHFTFEQVSLMGLKALYNIMQVKKNHTRRNCEKEEADVV